MNYGHYHGSPLTRQDAHELDLIFTCEGCGCEWATDVRERDVDGVGYCPTCWEELPEEQKRPMKG